MNPAFVPIMFKHTEVLKYYSDAKLNASLRLAIASEDWYQGLNKKDRTIVDEGVSKADATVKTWVANAQEGALDELRKAGMQVYINTSADKAEFAKLIRPHYQEIVSEQIATAFIEAAKKFR